jgi:glycine/D-amino acid oxidase-like deaminating enzyme
MKRKSEPSVVVIGGGVIGCAVAYYLSQAGAPVVLVERGDLASGTSGACNGYVWLGTKRAGIHLQLARASLALMHELMEIVGPEVDHNVAGEMLLIETDEDIRGMREFVSRQSEAGVDIRLLSPDEAKKLQPSLAAGSIVGATYSPLGMLVNPIELVLSLARLAAKNGTDIRLRTRVQGIRVESGRVKAVQTDRGDIAAAWVVNGAGVYAPEIGRMVGLEIPITPLRGQILVTEAVPPLLPIPTIEARYLLVKKNPDLFQRATRGGVTCGIWQSAHGNVYLGSSKEFVGYDRGTTMEAMATSAQKTLRFYPTLSNLHIIRTYAGLRPYVSDGIPILGPVSGVEGFLMAAGHGGDGVALAPITGKLISEIVLSGKPSMSFDKVTLSRFSKGSGSEIRGQA